MKKIKKASKKKENKKTKKTKEKAKQEEKLEEEIKAAEKEIEKTEAEPEFFEEPIRQLPITEVKAPVLERIIETQPEQQIPTESFTDRINRTEREERRIDYFPASNEPNYSFQRNREENEEKKYESNFVPPVLSTREIFRQERRQEFLRPQQEVQSQREEETLLEGIELLKQDMKLPFEQEQRKYKRHKLR